MGVTANNTPNVKKTKSNIKKNDSNNDNKKEEILNKKNDNKALINPGNIPVSTVSATTLIIENTNNSKIKEKESKKNNIHNIQTFNQEHSNKLSNTKTTFSR